jgi:predicted phosphodiesterase
MKKIIFLNDTHYKTKNKNLKKFINKILKSGSYIIMGDMFDIKKGKQ